MAGKLREALATRKSSGMDHGICAADLLAPDMFQAGFVLHVTVVLHCIACTFTNKNMAFQ